jgi:PAS domain S-box-containing protein
MSREAHKNAIASAAYLKPELPLELYHQIFMHSREAIAIISPDGRYLEQNAAHLALLGYSDDDIKGQTPAIHMGQEAFELVTLELGRTGEYSGEITCRAKSGQLIKIELSAFAMRSSSGQPLCYVGIKRDITEQKLADEVRQEFLERERSARADAEQANRLKDEFLATLSHELRTPLNAVIGWSRMLKSGRLDPESSNHALQVIERNAWAQKQIIEDILDVSRVITGKLQLKVGPLDLVLVVESALDAVRPAMEAKAIRVETIIDAGLRMITGDADRLQQVIWNLLSNAAKFTPPGGKVEIRVTQTGAHVQIQISDTGPGIATPFLPHVFERFRQADGSTTRTHGGLGLGLAIVRHLVELHGGVITAENRQGDTGAIFTLKLPIPSGELRPETLASAASVFKEPESEPANLENLRILVVDDESDALDLISMELTQHGAHVKSVNTAAEALEALEKTEFDLLISDIGMPDIDGYDLMRRIRRLEAGKPRRIPAVALTAYARVQDRMQAILAGYNTHVPKPVDANELITIVASLAGRLGKNWKLAAD